MAGEGVGAAAAAAAAAAGDDGKNLHRPAPSSRALLPDLQSDARWTEPVQTQIHPHLHAAPARARTATMMSAETGGSGL